MQKGQDTSTDKWAGLSQSDFEAKFARLLPKADELSRVLLSGEAPRVRTIGEPDAALKMKGEDLGQLGEGVKIAMDLFERDWITVELKDIKYRNPPTLPENQLLPELRYEVDRDLSEDAKALPPTLNSGLLVPVGSQLADETKLAREKREGRRLGICRTYPMVAEEFQQGVDVRRRVPPSEEPQGLQLLVNLQSVEFQYGPGVKEPFYCIISMWDIARGLKISEDFTCHVNDLDTLKRAGMSGPSFHPATMAQNAIFPTPQRTHEIIFVIQITKALQGATLDHVIDTFLTPQHNQKTLRKQRDDIEQSLPTLGKYSSPFGFCAVQLFHPDGSLLSTASGSPLQIYAYPKTGIDRSFVVEKIAPLLRQEAKDRKIRTIPGSILLRITELRDSSTVAGRLNPSGVPLKPAAPSSEAPVLEIQSFLDDAQHLYPRYEFVNLLFVSPVSLNLSKFSGHVKGRNLVLEISLKEDDSDPHKPGLPLWFGRACTEQLIVDQGTSSVTYHEKKPTFVEEFKVKLPLALKRGTHLLFLISHIDCKVGAPKKGLFKTPVAFAWLPLIQDDGAFLVNGEHQLPVSSSFPIHYTAPETDEKDLLKWIDKRPLLTVNVRVASSVFPPDPPLREFFKRMTTSGQAQDSGVMEILNRVSDEAVVDDLPVILDLLFGSVAKNGALVSRAALHQVLNILQRVSNAQSAGQARNPIFDSYVAFVLKLPPTNPADAILQLAVGISSLLNDARLTELTCQYAWVLCDVLVKWLFLFADQSKALGDDLTRAQRVPSDTQKAIQGLMKDFVHKMHFLSEEMIGLAKELGQTLAFFLLDLSLVVDRGFVLNLIETYLKEIAAYPGASAAQQQLLESCKMDALNVICSHEHFIPMNLPPLTEDLASPSGLLGSKDDHHLIQLLIETVIVQQSSQDKAVRLLAMTVLRNLLVKHDLDERYQDPQLQAQIACMYFSFVALFVKEREKFWGLFDLEEKRTSLFCLMHILSRVPHALLTHWWASESQSTKSQFFQALCRVVLAFEYRGRDQVVKMLREFTGTKLSRVKQLTAFRGDLARLGGGTYRPPAFGSASEAPAGVSTGGAAAAIPTKSPVGTAASAPAEKDTGGGGELRSWKKQQQARPQLVLSAPAAVSDEHSEDSGAGTTTASNATDSSSSSVPHSVKSGRAQVLGNSVSVLPALGASVKKMEPLSVPQVETGGGTTRAWKTKISASASPAVVLPGVVVEQFDEADLATIEREKALSREVMLTVVDIVMLYAESFRESLAKRDGYALTLVVEALVHLLHVHHTEDTFTHIASAIRILVGTFREPLFVHPTSHAQQITYRLLVLFNSKSGSIRSAAASLVYVMMRENWLANANCQRMKLAATIGINRTSDPSLKVKLSAACFKEGLLVMTECAERDASFRAPSAFLESLSEVTKLLLTVFQNMVRIREFSYDPERLADLYEQLCDSYRNSPDLRATWLHTLANFHESHQNYEEAAQCRIHVSALVSSYLTLLKPRESVPVDRLAFVNTAPNIGPEFATVAAGALDEGICTSDIFTRAGLFEQLQESVSLLKRDSLFESCIAVERLMCAIHHRNRDWLNLSKGFADLQNLCQAITTADTEHNRMFAKWYRVGLYGDAFGELQGSKFVYKERSEVMISSIVERLREQYKAAFGADKVHVLANNDNPAALEMLHGHAYLQIGAVSPYFEIGDPHVRTTDFERQTCLTKFMMETPFTKGGGTHGNWDVQCMRKTIISVAKVFPYVVKRLPVVNEETFVLEPIENALSVIQERVATLKKQNESVRPSTKTVQQFLSGSVLLQVNPGPLVIAECFLSDANKPKYSQVHVGLLQKAMVQFIAESRRLLLLNGTLIDASQMDYQIAVTAGYNDMRSKLSPFLGDEHVAPPVDSSLLSASLAEKASALDQSESQLPQLGK